MTNKLETSGLLSTKGDKKQGKKKNESRILELFKKELKLKEEKSKSRKKYH